MTFLPPSPTPKILVLDDEEVQRMTIHHQLKGLGQFIDFSDPEAAIAYLRENQVEAAIVDIRMPLNKRDGLWFLSELREFDQLLAVIVRTADDDVNIAQAGIEARAIQRVIKSAPNARDDLRAAVQRGCRETVERRYLIQRASEANEKDAELVKVIGQTDDHLTVAALCRGFVQGLIGPTTALASYAELLAEARKGAPNPELIDGLIADNLTTALRLRAAMDEFLKDPYSEMAQSGNTSQTANKAMRAVVMACNEHAFVVDRNLSVITKELLVDVVLEAPKSRVLTTLRHLTQYCALNVRSGGKLIITLTEIRDLSDEECRSLLLGNKRWVAGTPCVSFAFSGDYRIDRRGFLNDLTRCSADPRVANIIMVASVGTDEHFGLQHAVDELGYTTITLLMPIRR